MEGSNPPPQAHLADYKRHESLHCSWMAALWMLVHWLEQRFSCLDGFRQPKGPKDNKMNSAVCPPGLCSPCPWPQTSRKLFKILEKRSESRPEGAAPLEPTAGRLQDLWRLSKSTLRISEQSWKMVKIRTVSCMHETENLTLKSLNVGDSRNILPWKFSSVLFILKYLPLLLIYCTYPVINYFHSVHNLLYLSLFSLFRKKYFNFFITF